MRLARHAERHGRYPRFSIDDVVQFAVEEALDTRLALAGAAAPGATADDAVEKSLGRARRILGG